MQSSTNISLETSQQIIDAIYNRVGDKFTLERGDLTDQNIICMVKKLVNDDKIKILVINGAYTTTISVASFKLIGQLFKKNHHIVYASFLNLKIAGTTLKELEAAYDNLKRGSRAILITNFSNVDFVNALDVNGKTNDMNWCDVRRRLVSLVSKGSVFERDFLYGNATNFDFVMNDTYTICKNGSLALNLSKIRSDFSRLKYFYELGSLRQKHLIKNLDFLPEILDSTVCSRAALKLEQIRQTIYVTDDEKNLQKKACVNIYFQTLIARQAKLYPSNKWYTIHMDLNGVLSTVSNALLRLMSCYLKRFNSLNIICKNFSDLRFERKDGKVGTRLSDELTIKILEYVGLFGVKHSKKIELEGTGATELAVPPHSSNSR